MPVLTIKEPGSGSTEMQNGPVVSNPLWSLAFRPFYLGATAFSALAMTFWALQWSGLIGHVYPLSPLWHAHEMLFGYALAVMVGFLLTAVRVWTGVPTLNGIPLVALFCLWVVSRILVPTPFVWASALANAGFGLFAAIAIARPLLASKNRRNYFFVAVLVLFSLATLSIHSARLGWVAVPAWFGVRLALDLVLLVMVIMAGRIIPMFTNNGIPGHGARKHRLIDVAAPLSIVALIMAQLMQWPDGYSAVLSALATGVHGSRLIFWRSHKTRRVPLVWVLHVAYSAIVVYLLLRTLAGMGIVSPALATHCLTVGALGTLTFGMMVRTTRGHLGLPLVADRADVWIFILMIAAAVVRVAGPAISTTLHNGAVILSSLLWASASLCFIFRYGTSLCRPRYDLRSH